MTAIKKKSVQGTKKAIRTPEKEIWDLRLYVAGQTEKSVTAFANLKKICEEYLAGKYRIEIIDLLKNPQIYSKWKRLEFLDQYLAFYVKRPTENHGTGKSFTMRRRLPPAGTA